METERIFLSLSLFARARSVSGPFLEINVISGCNVLREENGEGEGYGAEDVSRDKAIKRGGIKRDKRAVC